MKNKIKTGTMTYLEWVKWQKAYRRMHRINYRIKRWKRNNPRMLEYYNWDLPF